MKTAKRVLAILMAMLMAVSTFAVAASAAGSLQTAIDNAPAGGTVSISVNTRESVVVTKDLTIDLGGKILKSVPGSSAITVKNGAKVTVQNGYVESYYYNYSGATEDTLEVLKKIGSASPAAITAYGAGTTITLNDVRAMGGMLRIPKTREWFVPTGSGVKAYSGATVVLNQAVLIGSYAISNDPAKTGRPDATIKINDAILIGYIDFVRIGGISAINYDPEKVEMVNAADRIAGYLNSSITLTEGELQLLDKAMDDRVYIFTQKPTDEKAIVTIDPDNNSAKITAEEVKHLANTDCSYKYVPINAYDAATGEKFALDTAIPSAKVQGKDIRINYRLEFQLKGDVKKFANNFDYYFNTYYPKAITKLDGAYEEVLNTYQTEIVGKLSELFVELQTAAETPAKDAEGNPIMYNNEPVYIAKYLGDTYYSVLRDVLSIGGVTMYNDAYGATTGKFTTNMFADDQPIYHGTIPAGVVIDESTPAGTTQELNDPENPSAGVHDVDFYYVTELGLLDKVDQLIKGFTAAKGDSFGNQDNWAAMAHYVVNHYEDIIGNGDDVIGLIAEAKNTLTNVRSHLKSGDLGEAVEQLGLSTALTTLDNIINGLAKVESAIADVRKNNHVVATFEAKIKANANNGKIEEYVGKAKRAVNNYREYFTPENFLAENGAYGKAYVVKGPTQQKVLPNAKLHLSVLGAGAVDYTPDTVEAGTADYTEEETRVAYTNSVTLSAVAEDDAEFLYYKDAFTNRILSTKPVYVVDTQVVRYIEAVFESLDNALVVFTNSSGVIIADRPYANGVDASSVKKPTYVGYEVLGWGPNGASTLAASDFNSAYMIGNSAFEGGAVYNVRGFAFPINGTTENKYIVTPKYKANTEYTVTFHDGENEWSKTTTIGNSVSYTAQGDGFKYWADAPENGNVVSVYRTYNVHVAKDVDLYAIYEGEAPAKGVVNIIATVEEDVRVRVYVERSIPADRQVLSAGILLSYTSDVPVPEIKDINNDTVKGLYTTNLANQGVLTGGMLRTSLARNHVGYARGFVELKTATGSEYIYSDVFSTVG